ncbi:phage holin family protein [Pseudonocardia sp. C8]|uniref:phage holin family protein n=1 Tax=Pseudonocardia sp. C8 TaxID=2762759 RepID=UPI001642AE5E|nr:phage holin family protein [Pseudonocardia sp. C8]MBC3189665.1 phage holin family protein [Pseudonocardia sp. C8]
MNQAGPVLAFAVRTLVVAAALWVATVLVSGIELQSGATGTRIGTLLVVALLFGVVNAVVKPVVALVGCPLYILTLGLFALVVNALMFLLTGWLSGLLNLPFTVDGFWAAFWGAIIVGIVSFFLHLVIPDRYDAR